MSAESERREFPRLKHAIPVRYKFMSSAVQDEAMERVCDGMTQNVSLGGLLLVGTVPRLEWLKDLLVGRITLGVNLYIPGSEHPIKFLTRVTWIEAAEEQSINMRLGLRILEIPPDQRRVLSEFLTRQSPAR